MTPVDQTIFGDKTGNCFAACLASLLEVPIESLPIVPSEEEWLPTTQDALKPFGLYFLEVRLDVAVQYPMYAMKERLCVMVGKSPRGEFWHAIVGRVDHDDEQDKVLFTVVHDPHPSRRGIENVKALGFLVKIL